jgi:hypothetical protein
MARPVRANLTKSRVRHETALAARVFQASDPADAWPALAELRFQHE